MALKWIDLRRGDGVALLEISDKRPNELCVIGGLPHGIAIAPRSVPDARRWIAWLEQWINGSKRGSMSTNDETTRAERQQRNRTYLAPKQARQIADTLNHDHFHVDDWTYTVETDSGVAVIAVADEDGRFVGYL